MKYLFLLAVLSTAACDIKPHSIGKKHFEPRKNTALNLNCKKGALHVHSPFAGQIGKIVNAAGRYCKQQDSE